MQASARAEQRAAARERSFASANAARAPTDEQSSVVTPAAASVEEHPGRTDPPRSAPAYSRARAAGRPAGELLLGPEGGQHLPGEGQEEEGEVRERHRERGSPAHLSASSRRRERSPSQRSPSAATHRNVTTERAEPYPKLPARSNVLKA